MWPGRSGTSRCDPRPRQSRRCAAAFCGGMTLATSRLVPAEIGDERHRTDVDRRNLATVRQRYPFEIRIERLPRILEQALLGEGVLGIEHDQFRFRLLGLEIIGDQARPLVRSGRTTEWIGRRRHHHGAAVLHCFQLTAQQRRLFARFPGMRHALGRGFGVAGQPVPANVDPGRQHQAIVGEPRAVAERHGSSPAHRSRSPARDAGR